METATVCRAELPRWTQGWYDPKALTDGHKKETKFKRSFPNLVRECKETNERNLMETATVCHAGNCRGRPKAGMIHKVLPTEMYETNILPKNQHKTQNSSSPGVDQLSLSLPVSLESL